MRIPVVILLLVALLNSGCTINNVSEDNSLKTYFDARHVMGCFGLYDNGRGRFTIYNLKRFRDSAYLPASTFKIVNSLIGLQTGVIRDENMMIPWDGIKRFFLAEQQTKNHL